MCCRSMRSRVKGIDAGREWQCYSWVSNALDSEIDDQGTE